MDYNNILKFTKLNIIVLGIFLMINLLVFLKFDQYYFLGNDLKEDYDEISTGKKIMAYFLWYIYLLWLMTYQSVIILEFFKTE